MELIDLDRISSDSSDEIIAVDSTGSKLPKIEKAPANRKSKFILPNAIHSFIRFSQVLSFKGRWVSLIGKISYIEPISNVLNIEDEDCKQMEDVSENKSEINFSKQQVNITIEDSNGCKVVLNKWILGEKVSKHDIGLFRVRVFKKHPTENSEKPFVLYMGHKILNKALKKIGEESKQNEDQIDLSQAELMIDLFNKSHSFYCF